MKVMVIHLGDPPETADLDMDFIAEMMKYYEGVAKEVTILANEGLRNSAHGKRVRFLKGKQVVIDGPFAEAKELIAGYSVWEVESMEQAAEIVKRMPMPPGVEGAEIEIREIHVWEE